MSPTPTTTEVMPRAEDGRLRMPKLSMILKRLRNEGGQAIVEFAVLLPVFVSVSFGIVDIIWLIKDAGEVNYIATEVARCEALDGTAPNAPLPCNSQSAISSKTPEQYAQWLAKTFRMDPANFTVSYAAPYTVGQPCNGTTGMCEVKIEYKFKALGPLSPYFLNLTLGREGFASCTSSVPSSPCYFP